jgi:hypothetical protein
MGYLYGDIKKGKKDITVVLIDSRFIFRMEIMEIMELKKLIHDAIHL